MPLEQLPRIDEHAVAVAAAPDAVWDAVLRTLARSFSRAPASWAARLLGCDPPSASGSDRGDVGSAVPGFRVVEARRPDLLVVAGRHRFSRYGIVVRIEPDGAGAVCRAESRAAFPGPQGALYRLAVIGSGGHGIGVRRLLAAIRADAEHATGEP
jgi:hypothetical protein